MKNFCLLLVAVAVAFCGLLTNAADAQVFGGRNSSTIKINNPGRANDVFIRSGGGRNNFNAANINVNNGFRGTSVNFNNRGFRGANVNVVNGFALAAPARFNAFGTRTIVTPAGIAEVDAFGNTFFRAPQASFVPATAFGTGYGGFGSALFVPAGNGFGVQTFSVGRGFCH
jgi:hypothetical protein